MNEVSQAVANTFSAIIQSGIDAGIPFDKIPKGSGEIAYLQCCLQWVIFTLSIAAGAINSLGRSAMGSVR